MVYKELLGAVAIIIGFISYLPYFRDIFKGKTKPHAFSWLIWAILTAIGFAGQISDNAGPGSWALGFTALFIWFITKGRNSYDLLYVCSLPEEKLFPLHSGWD